MARPHSTDDAEKVSDIRGRDARTVTHTIQYSTQIFNSHLARASQACSSNRPQKQLQAQAEGVKLNGQGQCVEWRSNENGQQSELNKDQIVTRDACERGRVPTIARVYRCSTSMSELTPLRRTLSSNGPLELLMTARASLTVREGRLLT